MTTHYSDQTERRCSLPPLVCKLQTRPMRKKESTGSRWEQTGSRAGTSHTLGPRKSSDTFLTLNPGVHRPGESWRRDSLNTNISTAAFSPSSIRRKVSVVSFGSLEDDKTRSSGPGRTSTITAPLPGSSRPGALANTGRRPSGGPPAPVRRKNGRMETHIALAPCYSADRPEEATCNVTVKGSDQTPKEGQLPQRRRSQIDQISTTSSDMQRRIITLENTIVEELPKADLAPVGWTAESPCQSDIVSQTPEPAYVTAYGRNLERFRADEHPEYRPKQCWCTRCQMMFRLHAEGNGEILSTWGNYPCHQF